MELKRALRNLTEVIAEEADRSPDFEKRLREALGITGDESNTVGSGSDTGEAMTGPTRGRNRRTPAVLDPVQQVLKSEEVLREQLSVLTVDQLKDIVADYGMDPSKLVMKWRTRDRIINHIVDMAVSRSRKGDAFRS